MGIIQSFTEIFYKNENIVINKVTICRGTQDPMRLEYDSSALNYNFDKGRLESGALVPVDQSVNYYYIQINDTINFYLETSKETSLEEAKEYANKFKIGSYLSVTRWFSFFHNITDNNQINYFHGTDKNMMWSTAKASLCFIALPIAAGVLLL